MSDLDNIVRAYTIASSPPTGTPAVGGLLWAVEGGGLYQSEKASDGTLSWVLSDLVTTEQFLRFLDQVAPLATQAEAEAGTSTDRKSFTPLLLAQAIAALAPDELTQS